MNSIHFHRTCDESQTPLDFPVVNVSGPDGTQVTLDISKKGIVRGYSFANCEDSFWRPFFSLSRQLIVDREFSSVLSLSWENYYELLIDEESDAETLEFLENYDNGDVPVLNYPLSLLKKSYEEWRGKKPSHSKANGFDCEYLICRCFGVYRQQIESFIKEDSKIDLAQVTGKSKAGAGCGSCVEDILELLKNNTPVGLEGKAIFDEKGHYLRVFGLTPAAFCLKVDEIIQKEKKKSEFEAHTIELNDVRANHLFIKTESESSKELESWIQSILPFEVTITFVKN